MSTNDNQLPFGVSELTALVANFYSLVRQDDLIGPMYPNSDWSGAEQRLRDFLIYRFGFDDSYIRERGHPRLRMRHAPFKIGVAERDRWLHLMEQAMRSGCLADKAIEQLSPFFAQVADFMRNVDS